MSILIDLLLVAIAAGIVFWCVHKGLLITVAEICAFVLAIFFAAKTAEPVAKVTYKALFSKSVQEAIYKDERSDEFDVENRTSSGQKKEINYNKNAAKMAEITYDNLPGFVRKQVESSDISKDVLINKIKALKPGTAAFHEVIEENIVKPIAVIVLKNVMFFVLAILYGIILRIVAVVLVKGIKNIELVDKTDKIAGGVLGVIEGVVIVYLVATLLIYIAPTIQKETTRNAINDSAIVGLCEDHSPLEVVDKANAFINENAR